MTNTFHLHWNSPPGGASRLLFQNHLLWTPGPKFEMWGTYSECIRTPSIGERFGMPHYPTLPMSIDDLILREQVNISPNHDLKSESIQTSALGFRWSPFKYLDTRFRGYLKNITDLIQPAEQQGLYRFDNIGKASIRGLDAGLTLGSWLGFKSSVSLNIMDAVNADDEALLEHPTFWTKAALSWRHAFFEGDLDITLSIGMRYHSGYWTLTGETSTESSLYYSDPGPLFDVKAYIIVINNVNFTFAFDNVLDAPILSFGMHPGQERTFRLGITWNLYD